MKTLRKPPLQTVIGGKDPPGTPNPTSKKGNDEQKPGIPSTGKGSGKGSTQGQPGKGPTPNTGKPTSDGTGKKGGIITSS